LVPFLTTFSVILPLKYYHQKFGVKQPDDTAVIRVEVDEWERIVSVLVV
jgi:hypothetical protein